MYVRHLSLVDFRSYETAELELTAGVSAFVGPNGHGKTNLVEALGYLATLGSHRVALDALLVRAGADRAVVRAAVVREDREVLVEVEITPGKANRARPGRAPTVPRRPPGRPFSPLRRGPCRLRPGAQAAQRAAQVGRECPPAGWHGATHTRCLGRAPRDDGSGPAGGPARARRGAASAGRQGLHRGQPRWRTGRDRLPLLTPATD